MKIDLSTEALARGAARRPWTTVGVWVVVLAVAIGLAGTLLGDALTAEMSLTNNAESRRADALLEERTGYSDETIVEMVIVRSTTATVDDPEYRSYVEALFGDLTALSDDVIEGGFHYYMTGDESLVSADRRTTLMPLTVPRDTKDQVERVYEVVDREYSEDGPFQVLVTGEATLMSDFMEVAMETFEKGESVGVSVALVVLVLVFAAVVAAVLPIVLATVAVIAALGAAAVLGLFLELTIDTPNMMMMMGLAVGIDYSLFIVSHFREERVGGLEKLDAIAAAGATAGRTVLFSGMTVVLALVGLALVPVTAFIGLGAGAILAVVATMLASLTLLSAFLGLLGDRVNALRIPLIQRGQTGAPPAANSGFWYWTARAVMRRPVVSLVIAAGVLVAATIPYFDIELGTSGVSSMPDGLRSKDGFIVLQEEFGFGQDSPALIVVDGPTESESVQGAFRRLETALESDPAYVPVGVEVYPESDLSVFTVRLSGDPWGKEATDAVERLRTDHIPKAFDGVAEALVGGETAKTLDINQATTTYTPFVFVFVLGLSFVLLTVAFRSIVVPAKAIVMNLLSVGAAYGLIVLVFQKGVSADLLGFQQSDTVEYWIPLFLFCILFGLSMDYHVFLLSRVRERFVQTGDNSEAVAFGLRSTGRLITGAALIMVAVFGGFALGDMVAFQQVGFGLGVAVLMDATIVRSVLVPAAMQLLGRRNWYLPSWLAWIPNVAVGEGADAVAQPAERVGYGLPVGGLAPETNPSEGDA